MQMTGVGDYVCLAFLEVHSCQPSLVPFTSSESVVSLICRKLLRNGFERPRKTPQNWRGVDDDADADAAGDDDDVDSDDANDIDDTDNRDHDYDDNDNNDDDEEGANDDNNDSHALLLFPISS